MDRLKKCQQWIEKKQLNGLWLEDRADLFYLTGIWFSAGKLLIDQTGASLLVDGRYFEMAKQKASHMKVMRYEKAGSVQPFCGKGRIGFDGAMLSYERALALKKEFPEQEWVATTRPLKHIRVCKEKGEQLALQRAAELTWKGYQAIVSHLKEGVSEQELAWHFECFVREHGAPRLSFEPIIAFGEHSAYPHYRPQKASRLQKGQIVLIDVGAVVDDYCGDMTRTVFFGPPDPRLTRIQELVQQAHDTAFAAARPGVQIGVLDQIVHSHFEKEGMDAYFTHSLGHGIGVEVHEYPRLRWDGPDREIPLEPGMVFTIEPGLYQPGVGGVRYENTVLMTESGLQNFYTQNDSRIDI